MARLLLWWVFVMTDHNPVKDALHVLHRDRAAWRLRAELDPLALRGLVEGIAAQIGVPHDVAMRVVESELEVRPLPSSGRVDRAATRRDLPRVTGSTTVDFISLRRAHRAGESSASSESPISTRPWAAIWGVDESND